MWLLFSLRCPTSIFILFYHNDGFMVFCVQWFGPTENCSFCWYWWIDKSHTYREGCTYNIVHDMVNRYRICESQMTTDRLRLSKSQSRHFPIHNWFRVCNQSNTMGVSRSGLPFRSIWVGSFVHVVKLHVYMCLTLCSDVRYDFRVKTMVILSLHHLFCRGSCLIYAFCF
jgi:hypothetical protein